MGPHDRFDRGQASVYIVVVMSTEKQISAVISEGTHSLLDAYASAHGLKKAHLVEQALLHHLQALDELPPDLIVPPRLVVSRQSGEKILDRLAHPRPPTPAMRALFDE